MAFFSAVASVSSVGPTFVLRRKRATVADSNFAAGVTPTVDGVARGFDSLYSHFNSGSLNSSGWSMDGRSLWRIAGPANHLGSNINFFFAAAGIDTHCDLQLHAGVPQPGADNYINNIVVRYDGQSKLRKPHGIVISYIPVREQS